MSPPKALMVIQPTDQVRRVINRVAASLGVNELPFGSAITAIQYDVAAKHLSYYPNEQYRDEIAKGNAVEASLLDILDCMMNPIIETRLGSVQLGDGHWVDVTLRSAPGEHIDTLQVGCNTLRVTAHLFNVMEKIDAHYND